MHSKLEMSPMVVPLTHTCIANEQVPSDTWHGCSQSLDQCCPAYELILSGLPEFAEFVQLVK